MYAPFFLCVCVLASFGFAGRAEASLSKNTVWVKAEAVSGVPSEKIYAMALKESGMGFPDKLMRPWPWTINSAAGAKRFATKKEAYAEIKRLAKEGHTNIDIGLMQINLRWHWDDIKNTDILDPETNVMAAARILRKRMIESGGNVEKAVSAYHSKRKNDGARYHAGVSTFENQLREMNVEFK